MKWFTHKAIAIAGALALEASPPGLFATLVGSILPDLADRTFAMGNKQQWRRIHRQTSHWMGWYLLLMILGLMNFPLKHFALSPIANQLFSEIMLWVGFGGITHVLLDSLTPMGISTGSVGELVFLIISISCIISQYDWSKMLSK